MVFDWKLLWLLCHFAVMNASCKGIWMLLLKQWYIEGFCSAPGLDTILSTSVYYPMLYFGCLCGFLLCNFHLWHILEYPKSPRGHIVLDSSSHLIYYTINAQRTLIIPKLVIIFKESNWYLLSPSDKIRLWLWNSYENVPNGDGVLMLTYSNK